MLASAAKALGKEVIGPSEIFRRDAWKPRGFTRFGLILIMAGIILLILYFVLLYEVYAKALILVLLFFLFG